MILSRAAAVAYIYQPVSKCSVTAGIATAAALTGFKSFGARKTKRS